MYSSHLPLGVPNGLDIQLGTNSFLAPSSQQSTVHMEGDPTSYEEAIGSPNSSKRLEAMEDEMKSMSSNDV
jgi:hypothetical protein